MKKDEDIKRLTDLRDKESQNLILNHKINVWGWIIGIISLIIMFIFFNIENEILFYLGFYISFIFIICCLVTLITYIRGFILQNEIKEWQEEIDKVKNGKSNRINR